MYTQSDRDWLPPTSNGATFAKKAGIRILWHPDLTSHLDIAYGRSTLKMFHDVALLNLPDQGGHPILDVDVGSSGDLKAPRST